MISNLSDLTAVPHAQPRLSPIAKALRAYLRSPMPGKIRLTFLLAKRFKSLHSVPIVIEDCAPVYMDLRLGESRAGLQGTPWKVCPRETAEQLVMRRVVTEGTVAFDIGANLGLHTTLLSKLVGKGGRVFAFEPNPSRPFVQSGKLAIEWSSGTAAYCGSAVQRGRSASALYWLTRQLFE